ncbi:MAG TPA: NAD(+) synthase [Spirochaetales bacterium]|nr:NAD(+) synthase [Spirochaetales bacterium]
MFLGENLLRIDAGKTITRIVEFIRNEYAEFGRKGIVVPLSGGLDSSVVAALCVKAVGSSQVIGLMLPERQGNPAAQKYAKKLVSVLGIKTRTLSISRALFSLGAYRFVLSFFPAKRLRDYLARRYMESTGENVLIDSIRGSASSLRRKARAVINLKQRVRLVVLYKYAEENNLLVVGSANLSEDLVGLFVKFGIDDEADLMPLKNLFRTQILQLGEYLELPAEILERPPNPDVIPGVEDKYLDMLGIPSGTVDLILYGITNGMSVEEIAVQLQVDRGKVEDVRKLVHLSEQMRFHSLAPVL